MAALVIGSIDSRSTPHLRGHHMQASWCCCGRWMMEAGLVTDRQGAGKWQRESAVQRPGRSVPLPAHGRVEDGRIA
ncbi:hypothetical protein HK404_23175 [Myxococcus xanthus]|nr:hypothetical protein [Myxococcus xanthus]